MPSSRAPKIRDRAVFYLNGKRCEVGPEQGRLMLSDFLRYERQLTGTKVVCAEGDCGACSVLRVFPFSKNDHLFVPINSCVANVAQLDGSSLITVDKLAEGDELSPVQDAMLKSNGSQCGFCTPGFVIAMTGLVEKKLAEKKSAKSECQIKCQEAKNALTGNLCRCTGYQPIIDAATQLSLEGAKPLSSRFELQTHFKNLKPALTIPLQMKNADFSFYAPCSVKDAAKYLAKNPDARLVAGTTDLGVVHNKGKLKLQKLISLHLVKELYALKVTRSRVRVGARVTLSELRDAMKEKVPEFARFLDIFASPQIKNVATLIGNVGNASPIADTPPFLLVARATVQVTCSTRSRSIPLEDFYLDYRKTSLKSGEIITSIEFDIPTASDILKLYKVSQRKDLDISTINAAFRVSFSDAQKTKIKSATFAMGGVAAIPLRLKKTEALLTGKILNKESVAQAVATLHSEMNPLSDLRGSSAYRRVLVENIFLKFLCDHTAYQPERVF